MVITLLQHIAEMSTAPIPLAPFYFRCFRYAIRQLTARI